jgi:hypothetical protein
MKKTDDPNVYRLELLNRSPTVRDQFAMSAMNALVSYYGATASPDDLAEDAYAIAAAMMKERTKQ